MLLIGEKTDLSASVLDSTLKEVFGARITQVGREGTEAAQLFTNTIENGNEKTIFLRPLIRDSGK